MTAEAALFEIGCGGRGPGEMVIAPMTAPLSPSVTWSVLCVVFHALDAVTMTL